MITSAVNFRRLLFTLILVLLTGSTAYGETFLMIVEGINKDVDEIQSKARAVIKLHEAAINDLDIPPDNLIVLSYKESLVKNTNGLSTAETIQETLAALSKKIQPSDRFIFYYIGQANAIGETLRLNLPGPDITAEQLADWLDPIEASKMLLILDCPNAGLAIKALARPGRIVLVASRHDQPYSPRFCEFFIPAITDPESDLNGDGKISLLETLQQTARQLDEFYRDREQVKHENFLLEDDGDGIPSQQPWNHHVDGNDGRNASQFFWKE